MNEVPRPGPDAPPPLRLVGWGLLLAAVDVRVGWFDLLPDVVGWLLVGYGVRVLTAGRAPGPGAPVAAAAAVVATGLSVLDLGWRAVAGGGRSGAETFVLGSGGFALGGQVFSLYAVATSLLLLTLTGVVAGLAEQAGDDRPALRWMRLRLAYVCTALPGLAISLLMLLGLASVAAMVLSGVLLVAGYCVYLAVAVGCLRDARRPWAGVGSVPAAPVTTR